MYRRSAPTPKHEAHIRVDALSSIARHWPK
jgi:hypothetical protein